LHQGVWEVVVPKKSVDGPLDSNWTKSPINVPSPGTIASYRNGHYHVHETATEWRVHWDRYDPKEKPLLHLLDDAPLLLMLSGTFVALLMNVRKGNDTAAILERQKHTWQLLLLLGITLIFAGVVVVVQPFFAFTAIIQLLIPLALLALGITILWSGLKFSPFEVISRWGIILGFCIAIIGLVSFLLPTVVWGFVILLIIALWGFGSAYMSLRRVMKGREAVHDGFYKWLAIGILSLVLSVLIFVIPKDVSKFLMIMLGLVALVLGITLVVNALRLRTMQLPGPIEKDSPAGQ
jgi:uncharacterized membrane protein HdeD (DUF308 family)